MNLSHVEVLDSKVHFVPMAAINTKFCFVSKGAPLREETEPVPQAPDTGLVVKIHYAGLCYSDVKFWQDPTFQTEGHVLGHEIAGEVYSLGKNVSGHLLVGDYVLVLAWRGCQQCEACRANTQYCKDMWPNSHGVGLPGGFQQYVAVPNAWQARRVPNGLGKDLAALVGCSALTAYNSVAKVMDSLQLGIKIRGYGTLLVLGAGGLGLWAVQFAKTLLGDKVHIYVADIKEDTFAYAEERGAKAGILITKEGEVKDKVMQVLSKVPEGVDGAIDFVCNTAAVAFLFQCLNNGGTQACVGIQGGTLPPIPLPAFTMEKHIKGVRVGTPQQADELVELVVEHKLKGPPITLVPFDCAKLNEAMTNLWEGKVNGRLVMKVSQL